jgi:hypothetical protein
LNEAFHQIKAKYANKRINYLSSTELRFAMAVIAFDNTPHWQKDLREYLKLDKLDSEIEEEIQIYNQEKEHERNKRSNPEYRKKANKGKKEYREKMKSQISGQDYYKPLCKKVKKKKLDNS